jgi:hypothetical protein
MSLFTQRRVRQETAFDRKAREFLRRAVTPTAALLASLVVCILCVWCFAVVFLGWPRAWAQLVVPICLFIAPSLAFVLLRELWRSGWDVRLFVGALLSIIGFLFWCAAVYFVIHPYAA